MGKALESYERALPLYGDTGDAQGEAMTLQNIGTSYYKLNQIGRAFGILTRALYLEKGVGDRRGEAITLKNIAIIWALMGNRRLSVFFGKQAINAYQDLRLSIRGLSKEEQQNFLRSIEDSYRILAYELIEGGRLAEAYQVLNLFKDQEFFDFIRTNDSDASVRYLDLTKSEAENQRKLNAIDEKLWELRQERTRLRRSVQQNPTAEDVERLKALRAEESKLTEAYIGVIQQLEKEGLDSTFTDRLDSVSDTIELQAALREISASTGQKAVALSTLVGKNYRLLLITADEIKVFTHPTKEDELNRKALEFLSLLNSPAHDPRPKAKELFDIILKPAESELERLRPQVLL
ncbi:MAG: hypothetical protein LC731_04145, partial [Acidobacteria bacterium]|nr:hypothetical protein [Acidobacteriota bacterium]